MINWLASIPAAHPGAWGTDVSGYVASALVLATFLMKSMPQLRMIAIMSNIAFISYSFAAGLWPILILHSVLLPVNCVRLIQLRRATRRVRRLAGFRAIAIATAAGCEAGD